METLELNRSLLDQSPLLAEAVNLAYTPERPKGNWSESRFLTCGDAQCRLLVSDSGVGCLAIAGTQATSIGDWASNLQVALLNYRGVYSLHTGFFKSAEQIMKAVLAEGERLPECFRNGEYYIAGHSLGASTAAILALLIDQLGDDRLEVPSGVVGFGSPLYVVDDGALLWPCDVLHIQSSCDIVSHIPTGFFRRPWARAGQQVYVTDKGFSCYPGHELARVVSYIYRAFSGTWLRGDWHGVKEHSMTLYETRVKLGIEMLKAKRGILSDD